MKRIPTSALAALAALLFSLVLTAGAWRLGYFRDFRYVWYRTYYTLARIMPRPAPSPAPVPTPKVAYVPPPPLPEPAPTPTQIGADDDEFIRPGGRVEVSMGTSTRMKPGTLGFRLGKTLATSVKAYQIKVGEKNGQTTFDGFFHIPTGADAAGVYNTYFRGKDMYGVEIVPILGQKQA